PDKLCDLISDTVLDEFLKRDPHARVACETFAANDKIVVAGEFRTSSKELFNEVRDKAVGIVRDSLKEIGYGTKELDIDPAGCAVEVRFNQQSAQIASGVDRGNVLGAGDQGLMFGYATEETDELMPLAWSFATDLIAHGCKILKTGDTPLRPDGKSQVTVKYKDGKPVGVEAVVLSWQHSPSVSIKEIREWLTENIIDEIIPEEMRTPEFHTFVNPAGAWSVGGPKSDTGLTGRKIIVDTYGGACPHGGGAFSGKDPSKVDRSGTYAARWVAKNVVAAGLAKRCTVQIAYAIGVAEPVSVYVDTHGTGKINDEEIGKKIAMVFDLTPAGIIKGLDLLRPIYAPTSSLGHFGKWRDSATYNWEKTDKVDELRR
ncbi:methionine adenosyltransferase, partial [Candidatus Dependentiae bacterium]